jgi:hypothetical protein
MKNKWGAKIKKKIRVHSYSFVAEILSLDIYSFRGPQ